LPGLDTPVGQSLFRLDQSFAGIFGVRHAYRGQQRGCSYKSFPLIRLSVISIEDIFNEITNDPRYLYLVLLNVNYAEVVNTTTSPF
jgi:hypothetical protein